MQKVQWTSIDKKQNGLNIRKNKITHPLPTAIESVELMHECCSQHLCMGIEIK